MIKKSLLIGALSLLASGAALANGFYAGAGIGGLQLNSKTTTTTETISASSATTSNQGNLGVNGELIGGYEFTFTNRMILGLEAFGNYTSAKININTVRRGAADIDSSLRLQYVYGARVLPGFQVTDATSFYGILGVARGYFKTAGTVNANASLNGSGSNSVNLNGYQLGLGTKTDVAKNIAVRTDLVYTGYQSKTFENSAFGTTYKIEPSTVEFNVAAVYKFG